MLAVSQKQGKAFIELYHWSKHSCTSQNHTACGTALSSESALLMSTAYVSIIPSQTYEVFSAIVHIDIASCSTLYLLAV